MGSCGRRSQDDSKSSRTCHFTIEIADHGTALSLDRNRRSEHVDRGPFDRLSCMASVDPPHAFEEEVGMCSLF